MNEIKISPQLKPGKLPKQPPWGLGGWFTLVMIGLIGMIIIGIVSVIEVVQIEYIRINPYFLVLFIICILNEVCLSAAILFLIYKRNKLFRLLFVVQTCVLIFCCFADSYLSLISGFQTDFSWLSVLSRILWTVYLFRSERVKNTFIGMKSIAELMNETETPAS